MLVAIDTETGGTNPATDALLSISACLFDTPHNTFTVFIDPEPGLNIEPEAAAVNGYTPELWKQRGAVPLATALRIFKNWLPARGNTPLAHNATFDRQFIEAAERRANFKLYLQYRWHCSMSSFMFANQVFDLQAENFKLETLARMCGHWKQDFVRGQHQSADDVVACAVGYRWLMNRGLELRQTIERLAAENYSLRQELKRRPADNPFAAEFKSTVLP